MSLRIGLLLWHAEEAEERAQHLCRAGHRARTHTEASPAALRIIRDDPPDVCIIDLARRPALGRDVAIWLRQQRTTRKVPIVFVEGEAAATRRIREQLPDATFASWRGIRGALTRALARPLEQPIVPRPMEGYTGTPLPRKLGIRDGSTVALLGAPGDFERTLGALPDGVRLRRQARGQADVVILFTRSQADLERRFATAVRSMATGGRLWIAWPKRTSGVATDLTQTAVRAFGLSSGLVDYKICAIDATWSALCFARRAGGGKGRRRRDLAHPGRTDRITRRLPGAEPGSPERGKP